MIHHSKSHDERRGARQPERFNPKRAALLDDPARFEYLPPEEVIRLLAPPPSAQVLDFGAGTGTYAIEVARRRPDIQMIALDEQLEMLTRMRAKPGVSELNNLRPAAPSEMAEFKGKIDCVMALNVLHEFGDEALQNLRILLKPDGVALFIDWNAGVDRPVGPPNDHVYSPAEARERLERSGFRIDLERQFPYHYAFRTYVAPPPLGRK